MVQNKDKKPTFRALCAESSTVLMRDRMGIVHKARYVGEYEMICALTLHAFILLAR